MTADLPEWKRVMARPLRHVLPEMGIPNGPPIGGRAADPSIDAIWVNSPNDSRVVVFEAIARGNAKRKTKLRGVACDSGTWLGNSFSDHRF